MPGHHTVDFFEIPVIDMAGAKAFYNAAFGWTFTDYGSDYADIGGAGLAGGLRLVSSPAMAGNGPLVILYSEDLVASERAVTAAGATVTARHEFPGGKRFHFVDPSGCELAVWTNEVRDVPGVRYACVVAGIRERSTPLSLALAPAHLYLRRIAGPNDGVVPISSQYWGETLAEIEADHWQQVGWKFTMRCAFDALGMYAFVVARLGDAPQAVQKIVAAAS